MSDTADRQLNRLVQMVAELSRREQSGAPLVRIAEVAAELGVSIQQIEQDLRTLTAVSDDPEHDWLSSLSVVQEGDEIALSSRGHFRRPIRLTPDELLAIQVGLADEPDGADLSARLAELLGVQADMPPVSATEWAGPDEGRIIALARQAANEARCLEISYAAPGAGEPTRRVIEVEQVLGARGRFYLVSWCRAAGARRHFRADRVLEARLLNERFTPRDWGDDGIVYSKEGSEPVKVRFHQDIARWIAEEHPRASRDRQGGVTVSYEVSDPGWLVRTVLGYGEHAEVIEPAEYRSLVRSMVG